MPGTPKADPLPGLEGEPDLVYDGLKKLLDELLEEESVDWDSAAGQMLSRRTIMAVQFWDASRVAFNRGLPETALTMALHCAVMALPGRPGAAYRMAEEKAAESLERYKKSVAASGGKARSAKNKKRNADWVTAALDLHVEHPKWTQKQIAQALAPKSGKPGWNVIARIIGPALARAKRA